MNPSIWKLISWEKLLHAADFVRRILAVDPLYLKKSLLIKADILSWFRFQFERTSMVLLIFLVVMYFLKQDWQLLWKIGVIIKPIQCNILDTPENVWDENHVKKFRRHVVNLGKTGMILIYDEFEGDKLIKWSYLLHIVANQIKSKFLSYWSNE